MAKQALTVHLRIDGARETLRAFNRLPKQANDSLRTRSMELATSLAGKVKSAGVAEGRQARIVAATVAVRRDRVPIIVAGGSKRIGRHRAPAYALLFGSEFGMNKRSGWYALPRFEDSPARQYKPHRGRQGRWIFPTADEAQPEISAAWNRIADDIVRSFGGA